MQSDIVVLSRKDRKGRIVENVANVRMLPVTNSNFQLETGNIGTLTFKVNDNAAAGSYTVETYVVSGSCKVSGKVTFTVSSRTPGDADGDGSVTMSDALIILQYFSGFDVRINESNADCDGDGAVTMSDALRILQYFSGFDVDLKGFSGFTVRTK